MYVCVCMFILEIMLKHTVVAVIQKICVYTNTCVCVCVFITGIRLKQTYVAVTQKICIYVCVYIHTHILGIRPKQT